MKIALVKISSEKRTEVGLIRYELTNKLQSIITIRYVQVVELDKCPS